MMDGKKVVKVFCHEEENIEKFKEINNNLYESAYNANAFANVIGPINAQLGNMSYVVCAIVGGALALGSVGGFTLGGLASFLTFNKSFNMPINQVSQQLNAIVMALAGAERIFRLMDEEPELDEGYVTLVNAKEENGKLTETKERTGKWAWKHTHQADGSVDYRELQVVWYSNMLISATTRIKLFCTMYRCLQSRVRRSRLSVLPEPERQPLPI